ncbi:MAG: DUF58 domain-containing protein [Actinomycetia bacterium]|nr:DUF58 domain-containing protein [Actinomycetes bacterium]MCP4222261.1 DUF58 domain-containing protein [Actinomycetes bacterium]MCP5033227.1 DUF58 domain-containing protein [Actinomycetes bacterium]
MSPQEPDPLAVVPSDTREVLRRLELDVTRRLDGLLHGDHRGLVPGHGSELGETRRYAPGDDVRRIDWNVTARLSEAHIRETIAERELQTWLLIDRSPRLDFGTALTEKRELVLAAAAAVGFLTNRDGNRLGAVFAGPDEPTIIPPRGSRQHFLRILSDIASAPRQDGAGVTDLGAAAGHLSSVAKRRGLIVVISDFLVTEGWQLAVRALAQRHEVLAIQVTDPREFELPNVGVVVLRDPATGAEREVATQRKSVRDAFAVAAAKRQEELAAELRLARIDHLTLSTDREWLEDIVRFVGSRRQRRGGRGGERR